MALVDEDGDERRRCGSCHLARRRRGFVPGRRATVGQATHKSDNHQDCQYCESDLATANRQQAKHTLRP